MAGVYNLIKEFTTLDTTDDIASSPYWIVAVIRLAQTLSYSRKTQHSVTLDVSEGAKTRGKTLIITSDCIQLQIQNSKENHLKNLSATLVQSTSNYLIEILPGDWVFAWIVHGQEKQQDLIERIKNGKACNGFYDGFKFMGRVESVRKRMSLSHDGGGKTIRYQLRAHGFRELDTQIFYDHFLSENSIEAQDLGRWLTRMGLDIRDIFATTAEGEQKDNVHLLISTFLELIVGSGTTKNINTAAGSGAGASAGVLRQTTGGGVTGGQDNEISEAPFAYLVPKEVGELLGKTSRDASKAGGILAFADILELLFGVQKYSNTNPDAGYSVFTPDIAKDHELTTANHRYTGTDMLGCFLPNMPDFDNRPLWNLLQQYLNPVVNEMYTCLRVNEDGNVVPTMVLRQIPFTTNITADTIDSATTTTTKPPYTTYLSLPRWQMPAPLVWSLDIGRSDASRCNFVHVYGQDADLATNIPITDQLVQNPPIRDDLDIQRSGLHTFMSTVACRVLNEVGTVPSMWMQLIADHRIGSQYTLNGTLESTGIEAPICEGDNMEFDQVVYHIESLAHSCSLDLESGRRSWTTTFTIDNGLRDNDFANDTSTPQGGSGTSSGADEFPIYPGFVEGDNTTYDPGVSSESEDEQRINAEESEADPPFSDED